MEPRRISIVGSSGSGKTTLAIALAHELGLPRVELDAINWQPGWRDRNSHDPQEFARRGWANGADRLNRVLPIACFDRLRVPRPW